MLYHLFEMTHAAVAPLRYMAETTKAALDNSFNPWGETPGGKALSAACEMIERTTRRYGKPAFGLDTTMIHGQPVPVTEVVVDAKPFCNLIHFKRDAAVNPRKRPDPKVLVVAPLSGHYATLLRGTVAAMLPEHDVYVTDWTDARLVPVSEGKFDLETYTQYLIDFLHLLGPGTHAMGVCQPGVPLLMATAVMAEDDDPCSPASITIMGSPIDTRRSPTMPNKLATQKPIEWFQNNVITSVPWPHAGFTRRVYPGFLQLTGFMTMNLERHMDAHQSLYKNLVAGDGDPAQAHREFYDEYLAVLDLTEEFYLQTVAQVFQQHALPLGKMMFKGRTVNPAAITKTALMTVEGENDDISGIGQTQAAHDLCPNIPDSKKFDYIQPGVGHYGVFNGTRWRTEIQPRVRDFIRSNLARKP
jgi:poly(3-hydroxybutyrate) depolymerase